MHTRWAVSVMVVAFMFTAVLAGCSSRQERVVEVDCEMAGENPEGMASDVADPLMRVLATQVDGFKGVRAVSGPGEAQLYMSAIGDPSVVEGQVRKAVAQARDQLPSHAQVAAVTLLPAGTAVPTVEVRMVSGMRVNIDRQKAAALGVSNKDIDEALQKAAVGHSLRPNELGQIIIGTAEGQKVRLSELATFETKMEPDHVVKDWP